jgi:ribosome-associated toxin RatA of RatAB toxin-antitoxin module
MNDEKLKRQLQYHIVARQGPMTDLSSKWDYETGRLCYIDLFIPFSLISFRHMEKINKKY